MPHGIAGGEILLRQGLVDNGHSRSALSLRVIPQAALHQRYLQHREVFMADKVQARVLIVGGRLSQ